MQEINSKPDSLAVYLRKIWQNRFILIVFVKRDLKIKYAQTLLGVAWTLVYPATAILIYTVFFSYILHIESKYPYVLFVLSGVLCWGIFSYIFNQAGTALHYSGEMARKMQFPKILIPLSKSILALVEFIFSFILFILLLFVFKMPFSWKWMLFPFGHYSGIFCRFRSSAINECGKFKEKGLIEYYSIYS